MHQPMKNVFDPADVVELTARINALTPSTTPQWGKMSVDQMLAHVNVAYEMVYDNTHPTPSWLMRSATCIICSCSSLACSSNSAFTPSLEMPEAAMAFIV